MTPVEVRFLADVPALAPTLARWHHAQWGALYTDWTLDVATEELIDSDFDGVVLEDHRRANRQSVVPSRLAVAHRRRNDLGSALHLEDPVELLVEHVERIGI